jgi:hypothetical protein
VVRLVETLSNTLLGPEETSTACGWVWVFSSDRDPDQHTVGFPGLVLVGWGCGWLFVEMWIVDASIENTVRF